MHTKYLIGIIIFCWGICACNSEKKQTDNQQQNTEQHPNTPGIASDWNPKNTWVFAVGVLEWENSDVFASFSKKGRIDDLIVEQLKKKGIPENQILYLKDKQAKTSDLNTQLKTFLSQSKPDDILFFYYAGHGYKNNKKEVCLASYDAGKNTEWNVNQIVSTIATQFKGKQVFLTADCCNSGGLADAAQKYGKEKIVAFNSVVPTNTSTGNWTFSNALLYALQGQNFVDTNSDKKITLSELGAFIDEEMAIVEGQKSAYYVPDKLKNWVLTDGIAAKNSQRIGERVNVSYKGQDYMGRVIDAKDNQFQIRFYSYTNDETDWVAGNKLSQISITNFPVDSKVQVLWGSDWYPGKVLKNYQGVHYISYDGYGEEWDEWVGRDRISSSSDNAKDFKGRKKGDAVKVEWQGKYYPAKITEVSGHKYKIRYDGYGAEWDEWVGENRIK